ncbi:MAG TPA: choice-of-anchor J domain-containing protein, partial [Bacteroidales bacterium]|nr:choice-of-anchor J domain-containing protein [Bacteroidales bacterium]
TWSVTLTDGGSYTSTVNGTSIAPGATVDVTMGSWTPANGEYTLTATVTVASDGNALNNELEVTVNVVDVISAFAWNATGGGSTDEGPVNILIPNGSLTQIAIDPSDFIAAADYVNNEIYGLRYAASPANYPLVKIDPTTGVVTTIGGGAPSLTGFAYDVTTGTAYAMNVSGVLYTISLNNGTVTEIGGSYASSIALACGADGTLYSVSVGSDDLAIIDKTTGAATVVGSLGVNIRYAQDIGYDRDNNILYGTLYVDGGVGGGLYSINTTTGAATLVAALDDELTGFAVPYTVSGPIATTLTPAAEATGIAINATVSATFNVPIFAVDLTGITITPNPGSVSASINGAVLTIAHADFDYNTTYTVNIPEGSVDDGTNENGTDITWSFTTALDPTACNTPSNIVVSNVQEFEATVTWTENGAGTSWNIAYGAPGFDPTSGGTSVVSNTTQFTLTNLTDNTQYELYVQANCGAGETSAWGGPVAFKTKKDCVPITTIPYTEGFEGDVFPPECWEVVNFHSSPTSNWHIAAGNTGNGAEVLWSDDSMMDEWLISPKFDFSAVTSSIELSFDVMMSYTWMVENEGADLNVKTSTDGGSTWTNVWREEDLGYFESWTYYNPKVNFNHLMGQSNVKFAFHFYGNDGAQTVVDNVKIDYATGIREVDPNQVKIYPNPSDGIVNIVATEASHITIYDMVGKLISTHRVDAQEVLTIQQSSGLYIVKVETEKGISSYKLVIK